MDITNHGYERYCERVLGISVGEIKNYLDENKTTVKEQIDKMVDESVYFHTCAFHEQKEAMFHVNGNWVIVINSGGNAVITLYEANFGFSDAINKIIVEDVLNTVNTMQSCLREKEDAAADTLGRVESEIMRNTTVIESLKKQMELLEASNNTLRQSRTTISNGINALKEEINREAYKVCYSHNYNLDKLTAFKK